MQNCLHVRALNILLSLRDIKYTFNIQVFHKDRYLIKILFIYLPQNIDSTVSCDPLWHTSEVEGINNTQSGADLSVWDTYN